MSGKSKKQLSLFGEEEKSSGGRDKIPSSVMNKLYIRCGGECAFEGCDQKLSPLSSEGHMAEAAHISARSPGGPRYDPNMSDEERDDISNLILLCPNHHKEVDKRNPNKYSAEYLYQVKQKHESRVQNASYSCVGFPELEAVTEHIIKSRKTEMTDVTQNDFDKIRLSEKIELNCLAECDHFMIEDALQRAYVVKNFIEQRAQMDSDFPEMLKAGFREHYYGLIRKRKKGHDLFEGMCFFVKRPFLDEHGKQYAAQAVLAYLFDACDIFERK